MCWKLVDQYQKQQMMTGDGRSGRSATEDGSLMYYNCSVIVCVCLNGKSCSVCLYAKTHFRRAEGAHVYYFPPN